MSDLRDGWAVVPAAGVGTRLRPHTHTTPKPLLHVAGKPILGYILDEVVRLGIRKLALVVGYMGDQIVAFARKNYDFCEIVPVAQHEPQGLGQAVYLTRECAEGHPTLIVYGDTVFDTDLSEAVARQADGAIGVRKVDDPARFGVVAVDGRRILRLVEKPEQFVSDLAIVGINFIRDSAALYSALETLIDRDLRTRGEFQLTDAFNMMVERGSRLDTFPVENWFDCGAPDTLLATNRHLLGRQSQPDERPGVIQIPPVYISPSASVENSIIGPYVSVGEGAQVKDALVRDSIIGEGAHVTGCFLEKSLVGTNAMVESRPRRLNVGDSSEISLY